MSFEMDRDLMASDVIRSTAEHAEKLARRMMVRTLRGDGSALLREEALSALSAAESRGRQKALEEAAQVCVALNESSPMYGAHLKCADAIRALLPEGGPK